MTPENVDERGNIEISYDPKDVVDFLESYGPFTLKELKRKFGYSETVTGWMIMDLMGLSIVDSGDEDWRYDEEDQAACRVFHLTEEGEQGKDAFKVRRAVLTPVLSFSKLSTEVINDVLRAANNLGMSLEELIAKVCSGELDERIQQSGLDVLGEFSGDELRGFAKEMRLFDRNPNPPNQA